MSVTIQLPAELSDFADGIENVDVNGRNLGEVISDLIKKYPQLCQWFGFTKGELVIDIDLLVTINGKQVYPLRLETPLKDGENIMMVLVVGGG